MSREGRHIDKEYQVTQPRWCWFASREFGRYLNQKLGLNMNYRPPNLKELLMKKIIMQSVLLSSALLLSACNSGSKPTEATTTAEPTKTAAAEPCTQETMMAKATELGEKMKGMAGDPAAMQAMATKMQEIQAKVQKGSADGSFGIEAACAAYDELLAKS